jgi:acyl-CoA hydrolase
MPRTQYLSADHTPDATAAVMPRLDTLTLTELVLPEQSNHYGTLFGPNGLALMGKAAYLVATRFTRQAVVMAAANEIQFKQPVPVGAVINIAAQVVRVSRSSLTARVIASLDAAPGTRCEDVFRGDFEMVTVDAHGRPAPVTSPFLSAAHATELAMATARS